METLAKMVHRGAHLLDNKKPKWAKEVRLGKLDMADCRSCVLGQLFGFYTEGADIVLRKKISDFYGFTTQNQENYKVLTQIWKEEIRQRRVYVK